MNRLSLLLLILLIVITATVSLIICCICYCYYYCFLEGLYTTPVVTAASSRAVGHEHLYPPRFKSAEETVIAIPKVEATNISDLGSLDSYPGHPQAQRPHSKAAGLQRLCQMGPGSLRSRFGSTLHVEV